jgi:hypothetical protein
MTIDQIVRTTSGSSAMTTKLNEAACTLLAKINEAVKMANDAEQTVATAQGELVSRSRTVGLLLLEAKKLHPAVKDFEAFLKKVQGLKLSRAYDLLRLAGGRTTDEELKKDARERKQKSRAAAKLPRPEPQTTLAEPKPVSVTDPHVTETAEGSAERRKADNVPLDDDPLVVDLTRSPGYKRGDDEIMASPWFSSKIKSIFEGTAKNEDAKSANALANFKHACASLLPLMTTKDLSAARDILLIIDGLELEVNYERQLAKKAKRIKWEAANPEKAKEKARQEAQRDAMESDMEDAKSEAKENGKQWADQRDEWIEEWIADNWGEEVEAEFEEEFKKQWAHNHKPSEKKAAA